jgi:hypothetical protein
MPDNSYPIQERQVVLIHPSLIKPFGGSIDKQEVDWNYVEDFLQRMRGFRLVCSKRYLECFLVKEVGVDPQELEQWFQVWINLGVEVLDDEAFPFVQGIGSHSREWDDQIWDSYYVYLCLTQDSMLATVDGPVAFEEAGIFVLTPESLRLIREQLERLICLEFVEECYSTGKLQSVRFQWLVWIAGILFLTRLAVRHGKPSETVGVLGANGSSNVKRGDAEDGPESGENQDQPEGREGEEPPSVPKMVRPRNPTPGSPTGSGMATAVRTAPENSTDPGQEDDLASIAAATAIAISIRNLIAGLLYRTRQQIFVRENLSNIALQAMVWSLILETKRTVAGKVFGGGSESDSSRLEFRTTVDRHDTRSVHYVALSADGNVESRRLQDDTSPIFKFIGSEKRLERSKLNQSPMQVEPEREVLVTQVVAADTRSIINDPSKQLASEGQIDLLDRPPLNDDVPILPKESDNPSDSTDATTNNPTNDPPSRPSNAPPSTQPGIELPEVLRPLLWSAFDGVCTVDAGGQISIDYLIDGGFNEGSVGIFDLSQMDQLLFDPQAFAQEAIRRVLSNSNLGHVVLFDQTEGAKFSGKLLYEDTDHNHGRYAGIKTFDMNPGSQFGIIMIPQGPFQLGLNQIDPQGPIFSLVNSTGNSPFGNVQMVSPSGDLTVVAIEDTLRVDNSGKDYNDVVIQLKGATGYLPMPNLQQNARNFLPLVSENIDRRGSESPIQKQSQGIVELTNDMVTKSLSPVHADPVVQSPEIQRTRVWSEFDGVYTVGASGQISIDYLVDGGFYEGSVGIFDLSQMDFLLTDPEAFAQEAIRRVLSNSSLGHVVLSDKTEGAKFSGKLLNEDTDYNHGRYAGVKTFEMDPGSQFGLIMIPQGLFSLGSNQPDPQRPIFSLVNASGNSLFRNVQMISLPEDASVIAIEDIPLDENSDRDYNDLVIRLKGAESHLVTQNLPIGHGELLPEKPQDSDGIDCKGSTSRTKNEDPFKRSAYNSIDLPASQLLTSPYENLEL